MLKLRFKKTVIWEKSKQSELNVDISHIRDEVSEDQLSLLENNSQSTYLFKHGKT